MKLLSLPPLRTWLHLGDQLYQVHCVELNVEPMSSKQTSCALVSQAYSEIGNCTQPTDLLRRVIVLRQRCRVPIGSYFFVIPQPLSVFLADFHKVHKNQ